MPKENDDRHRILPRGVVAGTRRMAAGAKSRQTMVGVSLVKTAAARATPTITIASASLTSQGIVAAARR